MPKRRLELALSGLVPALLALALVCAAPAAWADPDDEAQDIDTMSTEELEEEASRARDRIVEMQQRADEASEAFFKAIEEKENAERLAGDAQVRIDDANARIGRLQADLSKRAVEMYKNGETMDSIRFLLEARSLDEFIDTWHYLTCLANDDARMIEETTALREDVVKDKMVADEQAMVAQSKAAEADQTKNEIEAEISEYEAYIETLDAKVWEKAQEEAAAAAAAAASDGGGGEPEGGYSAPSDVPANGSVVDYAYSRLGCPYVWGGGGPDGFDCSGLVMWCYSQIGIDLPHYTEAQYSAARAVLPVSAAEPGDVLYMDGHVGICIESGGGAYIHAPTPGDVVRVSTWPMFYCALRF